MWGARSFVPLTDSIAQFNGTITRCPIVLDDECAALKSRKVTSAEFRQRVQATERDYEPKGQEKVQLIGCTREGITANDLGEVTFADVRGAGVADALRERLLVVECHAPAEARRALAAVRRGDDDEFEIARIAGHLAWIWSTHTLPAETRRFIGAGGADADRVALAGIAAEGVELWDHLGRWVDGMRDEQSPPPPDGWILFEGRLWGNAGWLSRVLNQLERGWDAAKVMRLLRAVSSGPPARILRSDGTRGRYWPLDETRVMALLD